MGNEKKENEIIDEFKSENNPFAQDVNDNQEELDESINEETVVDEVSQLKT